MSNVKKEDVKFVAFQKSKFIWFAQIEIQGELAGWLNWIDTQEGTICTVNGDATTPMGKSIATDKEGADAMCFKLQEMFEADEIGWTNINLKKTS